LVELAKRPSRWRKLQRRTWAERWLLVEAAWWLAFMATALRLAPFKRMTAWLGLELATEAQPGLLSAPRPEITTVGWAVRAVAAPIPGKGTCLAQALAAVQMLRRRGFGDFVLTLGVALAPEEGKPGIEAHAWLRYGDLILTGGAGHQRFKPISTFTGSVNQKRLP
jgi:hypothetical protein